MRSSFTHFEKISRVHENNIVQRGYFIDKQLFYRTSLIRKIYRTLLNKQFEGWRTYWDVRSRSGRHIFIKVYFGHDNQQFNLINGAKQRRLTDYFSGALMHLKNVTLPHIEDYWIVNNTYFIAFGWRDIQATDLYTLFGHPNLLSSIYALVEALSKLKPPDWWSGDIETHNFALTDYDTLDPNLASPFDADFIRNIAIGDDGKIYFHDFEKFQWSNRGLLELHLSAFVYSRYLRGHFGQGQKIASELARGFAGNSDGASLDQGIVTLNLMLKNMNEQRLTSVEIGKLRSLVRK